MIAHAIWLLLVLAPAGEESFARLEALYEDSRVAETEELGQRMLAEARSENPAGSLEEARILDLLVDNHWYAGRAAEPQVLERAERSLEIKQRLLEPADPEVAASYESLAYLHSSAGRHEQAESFFRQALAITDDPSRRQHFHTDLGHTLMNAGRYEQARGEYASALQIQSTLWGPEDVELAPNLFNLARARRSLGDYAAARELFTRALKMKEEELGAEHPDLAVYLNGLAILLYQTGDYASARMHYERALRIRESALGPEHLDVAGALNNLALLLRGTGDYEGAHRLLERALAIRRKQLLEDDPRIAQSLHNLAVVSFKLGRFDSARKGFEQAAEIRTRVLGPDHPELASTRQAYADLLAANREYAAARELYEKALATWKDTLRPDHYDNAHGLYGLAIIEQRTGRHPKARELYRRALEIREAGVGADHPLVAEVDARLADLEARTGNPARALDHALRAERISRDHLVATARTLPERQALAYAAIRESGLDVALSLAAAGQAETDRTWNTVIRSRAVVLDEMARRHRTVSRQAGQRGAALARQLEQASRVLSGLLVRGPDADPERFRALLDQARQKTEAAERALAEESLAFRGELSQRKAGFDEVARSLPDDNALVAFVRYNRRDLSPQSDEFASVSSYLAFVLTANDEKPMVVQLGPAKEIHGLVGAWRREAGRPRDEESYRKAGNALRRRVWDPVAAKLGAAGRVFVVADGLLNLVTLGALPDRSQGYLIESGPSIHYLSAERDLIASNELDRAGQGLLALGGPDFDRFEADSVEPAAYRGSSSTCADFRKIRFEPLPASLEETKEVAKFWNRSRARAEGSPRATIVQGAAASESAFKREAPGKRILHVATHGFFLGDGCPSKLAETRAIGGLSSGPQPLETAAENPLLLSGLVFAGANQRQDAGQGEDDGILTAEEVAAMDLGGVELAVLSACDTGVGEVRAGEGVFGLRRSFQIAGVAGIVMSLWPVEDDSAREWMRAFYENRFARDLGTAAAVTQASLELLERRREAGASTHPFYWAGFVAVGDRR